MRTERAEGWVVYETPVKGRSDATRAVCGAAEWARMEADRPGFRTLVRSGMANEGEAERLARGTSGDAPPRGAKLPTPTPVADPVARLAAR